MKYFEDLAVGQEWVHKGSYTLTEAEIREVGERWDPQPFHIDPVAVEASIFGGLGARGNCSISAGRSSSPTNQPG